MSKIVLTGIPGVVRTILTGGQRTPAEADAWIPVAAGATTAVLLLSLAGAVWSWRRTGLSFRNWWDSLR